MVLMVLGVVLSQCSEQMFGTDSVRNSVPSQLRLLVSNFKKQCSWPIFYATELELFLVRWPDAERAGTQPTK